MLQVPLIDSPRLDVLGRLRWGRLAAALGGWSSPHYAATGWTAATEAKSAANGAVLASRLFEPIRHLATFTPRVIGSPRPGVQVFAGP